MSIKELIHQNLAPVRERLLELNEEAGRAQSFKKDREFDPFSVVKRAQRFLRAFRPISNPEDYLTPKGIAAYEASVLAEGKPPPAEPVPSAFEKMSPPKGYAHKANLSKAKYKKVMRAVAKHQPKKGKSHLPRSVFPKVKKHGPGSNTMKKSMFHHTRFKNREMISNVTSSTGFVNTAYDLNPANPLLFPFLASMAPNFGEYKIHSLKFMFKSTSASALNSTNTALGTVMLAVDYDPSNNAFVSKMQMDNYEGTQACNPSKSMVYTLDVGKNTPLKNLYVPPAGVAPQGADPKFYNFGTFQLATESMQAVCVVGELWVEYDIEFFKPNLNINATLFVELVANNTGTSTASNLFGSFGSYMTNYQASDGQGTVNNTKWIGLNNNSVTFGSKTVGQAYAVNLNVTGTTLASAGTSATGMTFLNGTTAFPNSDFVSSSATAYQNQSYFVVNTAGANLSFNISGTIPASTKQVKIYVSQIDLNLISLTAPKTIEECKKNPLKALQEEMRQLKLEMLALKPKEEGVPIAQTPSLDDGWHSSCPNSPVTVSHEHYASSSGTVVCKPSECSVSVNAPGPLTTVNLSQSLMQTLLRGASQAK